MCGRYSLTHTADEIAARFDVRPPAGFEPRYNAAPTDTMPVVRGGEEKTRREAAELRWGLIPFWADDRAIGNRMINARSETVADKPAFRAAFRRRRCLIPMDGFYEWVEHDGQKWPLRITFGGASLQAFAGIWERWTGEDGEVVESYAILTAEAVPELRDVHDRMPVRASSDHWDAWLMDDEGADLVLESMIEHTPGETVSYGPVDPALNRPGTEGPELIEERDVEGLPRRRPGEGN